MQPDIFSRSLLATEPKRAPPSTVPGALCTSNSPHLSDLRSVTAESGFATLTTEPQSSQLLHPNHWLQLYWELSLETCTGESRSPAIQQPTSAAPRLLLLLNPTWTMNNQHTSLEMPSKLRFKQGLSQDLQGYLLPQ